MKPSAMFPSGHPHEVEERVLEDHLHIAGEGLALTLRLEV